jgi:hypothetical protein
MAELLEHQVPSPLPSIVEVDEAAARRTLRAQIARLEAELAAATATAWPRTDLRWTVPAHGGPRLLALGDLEALRDALATRVAQARADLAERAEEEAASRCLLESMLADPPAHKWVRVTNADLGQPGCTTYAVRPRLGLLGMVMGWWRVKVSSGCPLPGGPRLGRGPVPADRPWADAAASATLRGPRALRPRAPRRRRRRPRRAGAARASTTRRPRHGESSPWPSCACWWASSCSCSG